jgi:uncharacterized protein (UPF0332 family)
MTIAEKDRTTLIQYRIEKARTAEKDARFLIENDKLHLAVNRIYYGAFYILTALALKHRFQTTKHQQLIGWFNLKFVKEDLIEKKYGQFIHKAYDKRSKGDYSDYVTFDKNEVEVMHKEMQEFLKKIEELISEETLE